IAELKRRMAIWTPELQSGFAKWYTEAKRGLQWTVLQPSTLQSKNGATLKSDGYGVVSSTGKLPAIDDYTIGGKADLRRITGIDIEAFASDALPSHGPGRSPNGNFVISTVRVKVGSQEIALARAVADHDQEDYGAAKVNGADPNFGWAVLPEIGKSHELILEFAKPVAVQQDTPVEVVIGQHWPGGEHLLGRFRVSLSDQDEPATAYVPPKIRGLLQVSGADGPAVQALKDYYRSIAPELEADRGRVAGLERDLAKLDDAIPTALVMQDRPHPGPLTAYVHSRGEFLSKTDLVTAAYPAVLSAAQPDVSNGLDKSERAAGVISPDSRRLFASSGTGPADESADKSAYSKAEADPAPRPSIEDNASPPAGPVLTRLDLAKWLVSRGNPLTARVEVNRLWEQFFGRGIVETSEDFGTQGSQPSDQPLLDWLACEFMDKGWNMKAMVRMIVTSSTYRQSSAATPALIEKDPQDVYLERGPRFRLDAETIRDTILTASGLISLKIGGPSVFPYQPDGVWDTPYNDEQWMESKGPDRYRRGLYTFMKRSSPYPAMLNFDGTSREECTVRRIRTNTPLQALALLNDEAMFEAAKALGVRMIKEGGSSTERKLSYGFLLCTGRRPTDAELTRLSAALTKLATAYRKDPADAKKLAATPEQAAWTMIGNVLLNLDETVTKG
ncbi:MAG TPA: DUF1553 domain-containing protein, partial [Fimbriimonadaceae bacterium]|nr:DUF1553 domain-containing protein [Fimbriimonadaceae bacterium]